MEKIQNRRPWVMQDFLNTSNVVVAEYNFDACSVKLGFCERSKTKTVVELIPMSEAGREGRRRSADDWSYTLDANDLALFADRGFTGHEYLKYFNLYNMNGRLYDPLVSRFLSPDPYIQDHTSTLDYNRYAYCLNNPLKYTDPSGNSAYKDYMDATYGEGNYYYRGDAPGSWGPYNRNGGGGINGYSNGFGRTPSYGAPDYNEWLNKKNDRKISAFIFSGTPDDLYKNLLGFHYTDGSSYYYSDGAEISPQGQGGVYDWGRTGNTLGAGGIAYGALENAVANKYWWMDARGNYNSTKILSKGTNGKFIQGVQGYRNGYNSALNAASKFRVAGNIVGGLGVGVTLLQLGTNQITGFEASVDAAFGVISFMGPIGAGIGATYFVGKLGYEYYSGNTLFEKPQ